jgi:pimeloyl-ACP methyl ester carboxylesterase
VLLHSGEFGGCAELSGEHNIDAFAHHFRVIAPDWLGYGKTEKLFSFEDMRAKRVSHITALLRTLGVSQAHFVGNSMGGTMLLEVAAMANPPWPMVRIVVACGGGDMPNSDARQILNTYDCTREHMRRMVEAMFINEDIRKSETYIEKRHRISLEPGAWECTAAVRFKSPAGATSVALSGTAYAKIGVPVLIIAGEQDPLRLPDYGPILQRQIPGSRLHTIKDAGHCPQIDRPDEFNRVVIDFLRQKSSENPN